MDDAELRSELIGRTAQPVIAERQLVRPGAVEPLVIRIHQPEPVPARRDMGWRCGFSLTGLPELATLYEPSLLLADGQVFLADGEDSFQALATAMMNVRGILDHAEEELGVEFAWPPRADWGHMVPRPVNQMYGRAWERRLHEVIEQEEERLMAARTPNPYAWDDPRHPSQWARRHFAHIHRVSLVLHHWGLIGRGKTTEEAADDYRRHATRVLALVREGADDPQVAAYLSEAERDSSGGTPRPPDALLPAALELRALVRQLDDTATEEK